MKERPILFKSEMVRAILAGTKTQTRRLVKNAHFGTPQADALRLEREHAESGVFVARREPGVKTIYAWRGECPHGQPGDRLWVKETHRADVDGSPSKAGVQYRADMSVKWGADFASIREWKDCWRPSLFMPRWASRLTLEITAVRVERLNDISEADAWAEGVQGRGTTRYASEGRDLYRDLWESINSPGSWAANPFVWVITFKQPNNQK